MWPLGRYPMSLPALVTDPQISVAHGTMAAAAGLAMLLRPSTSGRSCLGMVQCRESSEREPEAMPLNPWTHRA